MKTTEELLEMSSNDLLKYCESLKYFIIDRYDFHIFTTYDIICTKVEYDKIHKHFKVTYHFDDSNIYEDGIKSSINSITTNHGNYCGLFESEQDAIDMVKQNVKKEIFGRITDYKQQIKELEKKIELLEKI